MILRLVTSVTVLLTLVTGVPAQAVDRVSDGQWFHTFLKTAQAHTMTRGQGIKVAVVDTGVDATHPDLAGSVLNGTDFVSPGGNGQTDMDGHGTGMAGLIAAHGRVNGIAPESKILPVRSGAISDIGSDRGALGIEWAVKSGAKVISLSWGSESDDLLLRQEVERAVKADVVVVAAVGNLPEVRSVNYPAALPGVIAVAGVDRNGNHSKVSVVGDEVVIAAPSDDISSTDPGGEYHVGTGTSDATAIVAGAVALIRSKYPDLSATEVVRRLTATATDKGAPGRDDQYGYGVLNLVAALTADLPATTPTTTAVIAETGSASTPTPSDPDGVAWWRYLGLLIVVIVAIAIPIWLRRRRA